MSAALSLAIRDRVLLYECYMPFIQGGGLFVPTGERYALGEEVSLSLDLMHEPEPMSIAGTVVWITPKGAQGNRIAGVGIRLNDGEGGLCRTVETYLAGAMGSERRTHTL